MRSAGQGAELLYYVDTSALYKRYRTELGTALVHELFGQRLATDSFSTSYLTAIETEATAARALRGHVISGRVYRALLGQFAADVNGLVRLEDLDMWIAADASRRARSHGLRAPDAIHLATALRLANPTMVTADKELCRVATAEGLEVLDPEDPGAATQLRSWR